MKTWKWIVLIVVALIVGLIVLKKTGVIGKDEGIQVAVEKASRRTIIETVTASGKIYPEVEVKVSSDISGEITELTVQEGDSVKRGQVLARIYADIYAIQQQQAAAQVSQQQYQVANTQAQLSGLKATMDQAQVTLNRQKQLLTDKVISQSEFEQAQVTYNTAIANFNAAQKGINATQAGVQGAQAALQRASKDVSRATITAPMDGVVSLLNVKKGERVVGTAQMAGTEMMRIADFKSIELRVDVSENDIPKIKVGDSAIVTVDAYTGRKFKGLVYQIASSQNGAVTATSVSSSSNDVTNYKVFIRIIPESYKDLMTSRNFPFRPGMTASADIQTKTQTNALSVPINAVTTRDKNDENKSSEDEKKASNGQDEAAPVQNGEEDERQIVVFVMQADGTVKKLPVTTGIQDTRYIEITGGLKGSEQVVSEPYNTIYKTLKNGTKVKVVPKEKLFEAKQ